MSYTELKEPGYDHTSLPVATFTNFSVDARNKSSAILVFGEHAREIITCEVGLWLARVLVGDTAELFSWAEWADALRPLGVAPEAAASTVEGWVRRILNNLVIKLLPIENVDGRQEWERGALCLRKTAKGVDLNRNYPFGFVAESVRSEMYGGPHPFSEPQSRLIARLALEGVPEGRGVPKAYINVHSGEWAVYSPWDSKAAVGPGLPADMSDLLLKSGDICRCMAGPAGAVSNYLAYGTGMDFMYTQLGVPYALTYEVFGNSGILANGVRNPALDTYPYVTDDRIARTIPRVEELLPAPDPEFSGRQAFRGRQHRAGHAHAAHARRSASQRADGAAGGVANGVGAAGARRGSGQGWRRWMAGQRRVSREAQGLPVLDATAAAAVAVTPGGGGGGGGSAGGYGLLSRQGKRLLQAWRGLTGPRRADDSAGADEAAPGGLPLGGRSMRHLAATGSGEGGGGAGVSVGADAPAGAVEAAGAAEGVAAAGRQVLSADGGTDAIMAMVRGQHQVLQSCFDMFNPVPGAAYREAVARWVAVLLMTLDHVADPSNPRPSPHPLPGTVLAGAGAGAGGGDATAAAASIGRRRLLGVEEAAMAEARGAREGEGAAGSGVEEPATAGGGAGLYGSDAFEARVRQRVYDVDPEMRRHSLVVLAALLCLGVLFVPWWICVMERPAKAAPLMPGSRRPRTTMRV